MLLDARTGIVPSLTILTKAFQVLRKKYGKLLENYGGTSRKRGSFKKFRGRKTENCREMRCKTLPSDKTFQAPCQNFAKYQ